MPSWPSNPNPPTKEPPTLEWAWVSLLISLSFSFLICRMMALPTDEVGHSTPLPVRGRTQFISVSPSQPGPPHVPPETQVWGSDLLCEAVSSPSREVSKKGLENQPRLEEIEAILVPGTKQALRTCVLSQ